MLLRFVLSFEETKVFISSGVKILSLFSSADKNLIMLLLLSTIIFLSEASFFKKFITWSAISSCSIPLELIKRSLMSIPWRITISSSSFSLFSIASVSGLFFVCSLFTVSLSTTAAPVSASVITEAAWSISEHFFSTSGHFSFFDFDRSLFTALIASSLFSLYFSKNDCLLVFLLLSPNALSASFLLFALSAIFLIFSTSKALRSSSL